ncbi:MAG TPA: hypothetical protein VF021_10065 [Longimicrobiales bacterium]
MNRPMKACVVMLAATLGLAACTRQEIPVRGTIGPSLVVEQFMRAANARDLTAMSRLFGTTKGPVASLYPKNEVEQRMALFAEELRHTDFEVTSEESVPGRSEEARQLILRITKDDKKYNVPFTLVRYKGDSWLIEQFRLDVLTAPR